MRRELLSLILLCYFSTSVESWRNYKFNFYKIEWDVNDTLISTFLEYKNVSNYQVLQGEYKLKQNLAERIMVHVKFYQLKKEEYEPFYIDVLVDLCDSFKKMKLSPLFRILFNLFFNHTNLPKRCPVLKNDYYLREFRLDEDIFPPYFPRKQYRLNVNIYQTLQKRNSTVAFLRSYFTVKENPQKFHF